MRAASHRKGRGYLTVAKACLPATLFAFAAFAAFAAPALAKPSAKPSAKSGAKSGLSDTDAAKVETARALGSMLHAHDQAAWHATDRALAELDDDQMKTLRGYIVVPGPDGVLGVSFHAENPDTRAREVIWTGRVRGAKVLASEVLETPRPLLPEEGLRTRAVKTAVDAFKPGPDTLCEGRTPLNTAVIEDPDTDDLFVYLLTPMTSMDEAVYGRHHRFRISADGSKVLGNRTFTNSCAIFPARDPQGRPVEALVTTHILDDLPQETHMFVSLQLGQPVYVMAGGKLFAVDRKRTRVVDED